LHSPVHSPNPNSSYYNQYYPSVGSSPSYQRYNGNISNYTSPKEESPSSEERLTPLRANNHSHSRGSPRQVLHNSPGTENFNAELRDKSSPRSVSDRNKSRRGSRVSF
jgi:hypothetical protein